MADSGDPDDTTLLAQLDVSGQRVTAWRELLDAADDFAARPHAEDDCGWTKSEPSGDGVITLGYPVYGRRVERARRALAEVGAVTPAYHWMQRQSPDLPADGSPPPPGDAVRLATAVVRGERFGDGTIGQALDTGTLQAVLASLAAWYRGR